MSRAEGVESWSRGRRPRKKIFFFVLLRSVRRAAGARERAVRAATAGSRRETEPWSPGGTTIKMTVGTPARNPPSEPSIGVSRSGNPKFFSSFLQFFGALANIELFKLNCDESKTAKYRKNRRFGVFRGGAERRFHIFFVENSKSGFSLSGVSGRRLWSPARALWSPEQLVRILRAS